MHVGLEGGLHRPTELDDCCVGRIQETVKRDSQACLKMQDRIAGRESMRREVLARLARDLVAKHPIGGHNSKQQGRTDRDEKPGNIENKSDGSAAARLVLYNVMQKVGPVVRAKVTRIKSNRRVK